MAGGAVSWLSKCQAAVSLSTAEAVYIALSSATQEAIWMRRLLWETVIIYEDNQSYIKMSHNPVLHSRTKHIDIHYHYIREAVAEGNVTLEYCPTKDVVADILIKPLGKGQLSFYETSWDYH